MAVIGKPFFTGTGGGFAGNTPVRLGDIDGFVEIRFRLWSIRRHGGKFQGKSRDYGVLREQVLLPEREMLLPPLWLERNQEKLARVDPFSRREDMKPAHALRVSESLPRHLFQ